MKAKLLLLSLTGALSLVACAPVAGDAPGTLASAPNTPAINALADDFLKLTLEAGTYEAGYIDAYYGPAALQATANAAPRPREQLMRCWRPMVRARPMHCTAMPAA